MHFFHRKRSFFFYPAGLISLVLLPLLGILYLNSKPLLEQQYSMEVNTITHKELEKGFLNFPDPRFSRKYQKIELTGSARLDKQKLNMTQLAIRQMLTNKDTTNGVHLIYGSKAKYESLIKGLDICHIENARTYLLLQNNLWVFYRKPINQTYFRNFCGTQEMNRYYENSIRREEELQFSKLHPFPPIDLMAAAKSFWPIGILYLIMVALTTRKVVRQLRNQQLPTSH